jgi:cobalt-zinc-cadmium efflux system protein
MIDPLISIGITLFIIWRTWLLLSQAVNVLMEGVPSHLNAKDIGDALASVTGVQEVHDLHIWSITSGRDALSAHIIVPSGEDRDSVLRNLQQLLQERFHIDHVTLQMMEQRSERIQPDGRIRSDNNKSSVVREGSDG